MTDFVLFARAHGLIIDALPPIGRWRRYATEDHPRKRNGAAKYLGTHGFVQNHATMTEVAVWRPDGENVVDFESLAREAQRAQRATELGQRRAAERAEWILAQTSLDRHEYLTAKGFGDNVLGNVWEREDARLLVVPMRIDGRVVGCQLIGKDGSKRFLTGQRTRDAVFEIGTGAPILCEGYATALSLRQAVAALKMQRSVVACFSAHNLGRVAKDRPGAFIVADNDPSGTGERVAKATGMRYWLSDRVGEDFNDFICRVGVFRASQSLRMALYRPVASTNTASAADDG